MSDTIEKAVARILSEFPDPDKVSIEERIRLADELRKSLPPESNRWTFRYIVGGVCLVAILPPIILAFVSPWLDQSNSQFVQAILQISATAVGALAAYLTGRRSTSTSG